MKEAEQASELSLLRLSEHKEAERKVVGLYCRFRFAPTEDECDVTATMGEELNKALEFKGGKRANALAGGAVVGFCLWKWAVYIVNSYFISGWFFSRVCLRARRCGHVESLN